MADSKTKGKLFSPGVGQLGMTQLHYDAYCGNLEGLSWCLAEGMNPNDRDDYREYTPVHWLADMAAVDGPRVEMGGGRYQPTFTGRTNPADVGARSA